ncbi:NAD-glutamate dehydrogenase [Sphingomonas hankyongi]|uniref:NAD-glutamate dehydrogenase n=1 Tax=Sphingomonas hankyongi TaxID=2908209 RepID=A0ABT0S2F5_9SPHN|nr:NAD-glutamate dehydrogenase domain-containing protein [Sphingomonas hankyongi]MCL6730006.1 NAD-glutamate dehydrogenase [Sphingomonas hankyongi]
MTAHTPLPQPLVESIRKALTRNALPGEVHGLTRESEREAAEFLAQVAAQRKPGQVEIEIQSTGGEAGNRRMRIGIVNDDMPFLVDSVANAIARRQITIHRLLHPVVCVDRDAKGVLGDVAPICAEKTKRESMMYIELDRVDARERQELAADLKRVLDDVRLAVRDWPKLQGKMREDAANVSDPEGAALLNWFADGAMTLLGYHVEKPYEAPSEALGIFSIPGAPTDEGGCLGAMNYLQQGGSVPLMAKAERKSTVHRRVPLDLVVVPLGGDTVTGIGVHAGLWTSEALRVPPEKVPVLREYLKQLDEEFGFDPKGHSGKALRHAVASLPRDLLLTVDYESLRELVSMAMSLADRPRPALMQVRSILQGQLFTFVWLPREELTTSRRTAIATLLKLEVGREITSWAVELGDGDLALVRYTQYIDADAPDPDAEGLDAAVVEMVRGWAPAVEAELIEAAGAARATRLSITYINTFPDGYRARTAPEEGAADILRLSSLADDNDRAVRIWRAEGDATDQLRLKTYRQGGLIPLSEAVPVMENFGFRVLEELPTALAGGMGYIHDFRVELASEADVDAILARSSEIETAIAGVLCGVAEDDEFNQLVLYAGLPTRAVVWLRAWFRYLRQTGSSFGLVTVVDALRRAPNATAALIGLFTASHDPGVKNRDEQVSRYCGDLDRSLAKVRSIDDDRILRRLRALVEAMLRTNAFAPAAQEALAFKINSSLVPGLPAPVPWREIWVYSPRVEGIHLRGGPVARGGLRWSDRRDDFRTEILGLMKAQLVKNAVIVPTGAKGGFYPKQLPPSSNRDAWLAEGTESYRIFIRSLLSVTDNLVNDKVVHPDCVVVHDGDDPYFVVAADKGTATFSDVANALALERNFWLGDAFASGGSNGYDHKAMGITARGAWISVQRHFLEMGIDVQSDPITVAGCGDMSGDVFGNGMLLSKALKLVAAFDHRHIFIDPDPDPAASWKERKRMFELPRSSWDDYDRKLLSKGGGIYPRTEKSIELSAEARELLGIEAKSIDPTTIINAILKAEVDLLWFGGIGTYIKASTQSQADVGDPSNDALRADARDLRAKAIGEGANLAITQGGRIEFAENGGRINTDFIDNSAGVDCSDNEVNIKIPLNREMREGRLSEAKRNSLLAKMTDEVAELVLEDNRLQSLALSIAESGGHQAVPAHVRTIEILEASGRLDRKVEGLDTSEELLRRSQENRGLTRPELAVVLSISKIVLQDAAEDLRLADDPLLEPELFNAFPKPMRKAHADAIRAHRLRHDIVATKVANRLVNRLGPGVAFDLMEEEGASLQQVIVAFLVAERLLDIDRIWEEIELESLPEAVRVELFMIAATTVRSHISDILRCAGGETNVSKLCDLLAPSVRKIAAAATKLIRMEVRNEAAARRDRLLAIGASEDIVRNLVRLYELDGIFGVAALAARRKTDELALTRAYTRLGEALGLDWAQQQAARFTPTDQWERLLAAGLERDFEQLRLEFMARHKNGSPDVVVEEWIEKQRPRIEQFRQLVARARAEGHASAAMLGQIASQARILLAR